MAQLGDFIRNGRIEDRRDDPWPWHQLGARLKDPQQTVGIEHSIEPDHTLEPISPLAMQAGATQVAAPTPEEMIKFLIQIDALNAQNPPKPGEFGQFEKLKRFGE